MPKYDTTVPNPFVQENPFLGAEPQQGAVPDFQSDRHSLPQPFWSGHPDEMDCYWRSWELAFRNLRQPVSGSGFVSNFIDTAFNDHLFMWDSAFILLFARYGCRAFNFQQTLDNFYSHQHSDGFISREIYELNGDERFEKFDPASTGPNVMTWTEWEYFQNFGDTQRLARVFPCLVAYYQWFRAHRSWPDGTYWTCGLGSGMDNQPRMQNTNYNVNFSHGFMTWIDATLQQILAARQLLEMAKILKRESDIADIKTEFDFLTEFTNQQLWDDTTAFYFDRWRSGELSDVKSIGAYWALLAGIVPPDRLEKFIAHLRNTHEFSRPHRVPSLSADHRAYSPHGDYWRGSVWPPTNYMVLRGLTQVDNNDLAHEIALNHLENVVQVFRQTNTVWENYAPEQAAPGKPAKDDFVGWSGLGPIAVLFEYVFGIRADVPRNRIVWDVRLLEEHGVKGYPFGTNGLLDLHCAARESETDEPKITVSSNIPVTLFIQWSGNQKQIQVY